MAQGVLPFKYEAEKKTTGMTALAGLPVYPDLTKVTGLSKRRFAGETVGSCIKHGFKIRSTPAFS